MDKRLVSVLGDYTTEQLSRISLNVTLLKKLTNDEKKTIVMCDTKCHICGHLVLFHHQYEGCYCCKVCDNNPCI
jgi:hypothetical protein